MAMRTRYNRTYRGGTKRRRGSRRYSRRGKYRRRSFRRYRRRSYRRMTRRRVANIASIKKRDNMLPFAQTDAGGTGTAGPFVMNGGEIYGFLFSPSARRTSPGYAHEFVRNKAVTFSKGYSERSTFEANNGSSWMWRRIVFAIKDPDVREAFPPSTIDFAGTPYGQMRSMWNFLNASGSGLGARQQLEQKLFQGTQEEDWIDRFTAKVDTKQVRFLGQFRRTLGAGNTDGQFYTQKEWYGINRSLIYFDEEEGFGSKASTPWSTMGPGSIGDIMVYDIFACAAGDATDTLEWLPQGTYYWHEH